jgi:hypothetical protein
LLKIMKKITFLSLFVFSLLFGLTVLAANNSSTNYIISDDAFTSGGSETSSSTSYGLQDSLGEAIINSATTTSSNYGIKSGFRELYPDQSLSFSIPDSTVNLGTLTDTVAATDSNTMIISTNASSGFVITATGNAATLTSGGNTITAIGATAAASTPGTEQFGINLVANTSPSIGANPAGTAPLGSAANQYNVSNSFAWSSGATVATSSAPIGSTTLTVSYLANIAAATEDGTYALTITYAATGNF